ncbi:hypothetical protein CDAR_472191 [Caerostris darwini]|uniref:Uncharacterized protein n=1 Tax=Caerostris darwini TaxID=1538125 RepID=A0AAV4VLC6_9ARAC|nr:hypothetical protein CDAR_472191 [Caerostris darwini]
MGECVQQAGDTATRPAHEYSMSKARQLQLAAILLPPSTLSSSCPPPPPTPTHLASPEFEGFFLFLSLPLCSPASQSGNFYFCNPFCIYSALPFPPPHKKQGLGLQALSAFIYWFLS